MSRAGIIPAAGKADRFGGTLKELLPIGDHAAIMDYSVDAMRAGGADPIIVVASERKIAALADYQPELLYTLQTGGRDILGAILAGCRYAADEYLFAMPDTIIPIDAFHVPMTRPFMLGIFNTSQPERYGMVRGDYIVNKEKGAPGAAWGVLMWNKEVRDHWLKYQADINSYTDAFTLAMQYFGFRTFELSQYIDISNFAEYERLIRGSMA